jgi:hypothetical protein
MDEAATQTSETEAVAETEGKEAVEAVAETEAEPKTEAEAEPEPAEGAKA